jgi:RNA polymerase sigma-70 factor (ECF subfamily)
LKCDQFQKDRLFRPWLYAISTHQAIDLQRKNKRHRMVSLDNDTRGDEERVAALVDLLESRETPPLAGLETAERTQWVRKTVDALPETLRSTLVLVYYQGLKYREAAEVLSIPVGTVKSRLHTAILKLNQAWQSSGPQP